MAVLRFFGRRKPPLILQTEAVECGLACLAMVAGYHGHDVDLASLRLRFPISVKGTTLQNLMQMSQSLELGTRALRCELEDLDAISTPAILHWNLNHFVVLVSTRGGRYEILDPARGSLILDRDAVSKHFTGIALELTPTPTFEEKTERQSFSVWSLWGQAHGIGRAALQIILLSATLEVFAIVAPFYQQLLVDSVIVSSDRDLLTVLALGFGLLVLIQCSINAARSWALLYLGTTMNVQLVRRLFKHVLSLPLEFFEKRHIGDIQSRFGSLDVIQRTMTTSFLMALIDGVMVIAMLILMFSYSAQLGFVTCAATLIYGGTRVIFYWRLRRASEEALVRGAKQQSHFLESIRGLQTVKLFGRESLRQNSYDNLLVERMNADIRVQQFGISFQTMQLLVSGIENIIVLYIGARLVLDGNFTIGMLFAYLSYKLQFSQRSSALIDKWIELRMLNLHAERLADLALAKADQQESARNVVAFNPKSFSIEVRNLTFRRSPQEKPVFENVTFSCSQGEVLAITGASGCGKTTLIKVLLGLLRAESGEIYVGGQPLDQVSISSYRASIGTVMQDDQLFAGSVLDNITFFDSEIDMGKVEAAAKLAALHDDIANMPMQYNTFIGEMGNALSGGQRQRLILARALYKEPKILFLDEATSHVDVVMEKKINSHLRQLDVTVIMVAHRPETISAASRVLVLESNGGLQPT